MSKVQPYPRQELRRLKRDWRRRNARLLLAFTAFVTAVLLVVTVFCVRWATPTGFGWYLLGAAHAGAVAACLRAVDSMFLAHDGRAIHQLRGALGEDITRDELKRARRRRLIWGWVDTITLQAGDIDHLVVTRRGGIVAIDTKWRTGTTADAEEMARAANRARTRAEGLTRSLWRAEPGARHRAKVHPLPVTSIVVVWGALQHSIPEGAEYDGIEFVPGLRLTTWLARLDREPVSKDAGREILQRMAEFRDRASAST
jgi:Nuclease-related domain